MKRLLTVIMAITIAIASTACSSNKVKNQEELKPLNNTNDNVQENTNANIDIDSNIEQNQDKIEEINNEIQISLESREPGYMKEYNAISLSEKNINEYPYPEGGRTRVSKLKIEDNNLIVWGSLECIESGSSEVKYLEEKKRTFKLSQDVDLGLDWVGSREEQIQYFNDMGEDLSSMLYFRTIKEEVTYITFAG